jgi:metal-responsive CopG/Arc/MetJ family transcriptional regulator
MEAVMSRILVDLPDSQVEELAVLVEAEQRPRAAVIRDAIEAYIAQHKRALGTDVFGLWKSKKVDGLEYQQELRSEW